MKDLRQLHDYGFELERRIRLQTYPIGIKLLKNEQDIPSTPVNQHVAGQTLWALRGEQESGDLPERPLRPLKDLGYHVALCQGYAMSRKEGITVAMFKEDMWCFEPIVGYGWNEPPEAFLEGRNRYPQDVKDLRAGRNYVSDFPRLPLGTAKGVISAPLHDCAFYPDVVMIYCDSSQLSLLLLGREWKDGHDLSCHLSSHAACVYSVVTAMQKGEFQVSIPCRGDHYFAMASDTEMILSFPITRLHDLITGLRHLAKSNYRLPRLPQMRKEPTFPKSYMDCLELVQRKTD
jgi:uncharacterized protein (DUF169 family)